MAESSAPTRAISVRPAVESGWHALSVEFRPTGAPDVHEGRGARGTIELFIDAKRVGGGALAVTVPLQLGGALVVGANSDSPITSRYRPPFAFTGKLEKVIYDVSGAHVRDFEGEIRAALAMD
jgi:arylsulfatase